MNKDVIYIEPEDDITDILANIKSAKNNVVALIPPKKAGVLRSAVNFKLIAKTARQEEKTIVLITSDESLKKLAENVKMPIARTLQSKPKLPEADDAVEFGDDADADSDVIEDDEAEEAVEEEPPKKATKPVAAKKTQKATAKEPDLELDDADLGEAAEDGAKAAKKSKKKSDKNIPDFKKVRKPIIIGVIAFIAIAGFLFWAIAIAPAAKINVKVKTAAQNFNESISFTATESEAKPEEGIFYLEEKSLTKTAETEFDATGEVDKGAKATGSIKITRPSGDSVNCNDATSSFSIPQGTHVTINGKNYITTTGGSANAGDDLIGYEGRGDAQICFLKQDVSSENISVVAEKSGESYNIDSSTDGKLSITTDKNYTVSSSAMTGGTSKKVKVVSQKDVEAASSSLDGQGESEAHDELASQFGGEYLIIEKSFTTKDGKISSSPAINEEVKDGVQPKAIKEIKYTVYAVERESLIKFIKAKSDAGDDTQIIYSTGVAEKDGDEDKAYIDSFKKEGNKFSGKLKSVVRTGPEVTEQMISEKSLGHKIGEVQSLLRSIKGVSEVKIDTSYFWVTSIPSDPNKVTFEISVE